MGVLTGAIAIIKDKSGNVIGKMRGITVTENIQRTEVRGLGQLIAEEVPPTIWTGTLRCQFYNINFKSGYETGVSGKYDGSVPNAIIRTVKSVNEFEDTLTLTSGGVTVNIYQRIKKSVDATTGIITPELKLFVTINELYIDSDDFDINEGQISGRNQSFRFISPIIYNS